MTGVGFVTLMLALTLVGCAAPDGKTTHAGDERLAQLQGDKALSLAAVLSPVGSAQEALALGDEAAARGDRDEAVLRYVRAAELQPGDSATIHKIGLMHDEMGNASLAVTAYRLSLEADGNYAPAHESLGLLLMRGRKLDEARQMLQRAVALDRSRWRSHNGLGILADLDGRFEDAVGHYRSAMALQPASAMAVTNLGYSYYLQSRYDEARKHFEHALELEPRYFIARRNLAIIHVREREFDKALRLLAAGGDTAAAYNDLGYLCMLAGEYSAARRFLNRAIELSPTYYARAHENLDTLARREARGEAPANVTGEISRAQRLEALPPATAGTRGPTARTLPLPDTSTSAPIKAMESQVQSGPLLQQRLDETGPWLAGLDNEDYTVQLMATNGDAEDALERFLREQAERGLLQSTYVYRRPGTGGKRYYVLYGSFPEFSEATHAVEELPESLRGMQPYVRRIKQFRLSG
jgi:Flp pilus assembly protein TadD